MSEKIKDKNKDSEELFLAEKESAEVSKINDVVGEEVSEVIENASETISVAKDKEDSAKKKDLAFSQHSTFFKQQLEQAMILEMQRQEMAFIRDSKSNSSYHMQRALNYDLLKERMANSVKQTPEFIALDEEKQAAYLAALDSHLEQGKIDYHNTLLQKTYDNLKSGGAFQEHNRRQNIILLERAGFSFPSEIAIDDMFNNFSKFRKSEDNATKFQQFQGMIANLPDLQLSDEERAVNYAKFLDKIKPFSFSDKEKHKLVTQLQDRGYLNNNGWNLGLNSLRTTGSFDSHFFKELARNEEEFIEVSKNSKYANKDNNKFGLMQLGVVIGTGALTAMMLPAMPVIGAFAFAALGGAVGNKIFTSLVNFKNFIELKQFNINSNKDLFNQKFAQNFPSAEKALTLLEQQTDLTPEQKQVILDRLKSNDKKTVEDIQLNLILAYGGQASEQDRKQALSNLI